MPALFVREATERFGNLLKKEDIIIEVIAAEWTVLTCKVQDNVVGLTNP